MQLVEPLLNLASCLDDSLKLDVFLLARIHGLDLFVFNVDPDDVIKAGLQVLLHDVEVLRVGQDIDELIVGQEVETWECSSLRLHIILKSLLDILQLSVIVLKLCQCLGTRFHDFEAVGVLLGGLHEINEEFVDCFESPGLLLHCFTDVLGSHVNILKIHPVLLAHRPLIDHIIESHDPFLPLFCLYSQRLDESGSENGIDRGQTLIKSCVNIIKIFEDVGFAPIFPLDHEDDSPPLLFQGIKICSQTPFLLGLELDRANLFLILVHIEVDQ